MAAALVADESVGELGADLLEHHKEHRAMAALEELFLLLDQIWRLVAGIRSHRGGRDSFLSGYRRYGQNIAAEYENLQAMTENDWREVMAIPPDAELESALSERGVEAEGDVAQARELAAEVLATTVLNMNEIGDLFVRSDPVVGTHGKSMRDVNSAYRHGTQVVYEDCSPAEIPWRAANPGETQGMLVGADQVDSLARTATVNVLLEGPDEEGHARFASIPRSEEAHESLIEGMRHLSVLLWRLVASFLTAELLDCPVMSAIAPLDWGRLSRRFTPEEESTG